MKNKFIAAALATLFMLTFLGTAAYAGPYDSVFAQATFSTLVEFDKNDILTYELRGFCSSTDGKYLFGGLLQNLRRVIKIDAATGEVLGEYSDDEPGYPKGLAADDRGYLYVGIANAANDGAVGFAIVDIESMEEVKFVSTEIAGKVGVNGVAVAKLGGKYYLYVITNYDTDRLYRWDVTDPKNPVMDASFGKSSGYTDLQELTGSADCDANYLAVDGDGVIYMTAKVSSGSKGDTLLKLSADGKSIISTASLVEPYGIYFYDGYVLVSTYNGADSVVYVINASDLSTVCEIADTEDSARYSGVTIAGDKIYISDQGYGLGDRILVSNKLEFPASEPAAQPEAAAEEAQAPVEEAQSTAPAADVIVAAKTYDSSAVLISATLACAALVSVIIFKRRR